MRKPNDMDAPIEILGENYFHSLAMPVSVLIENETKFPLHHHNFTELVFILAGRGWHWVDGYEYPLNAGDVFCLQPQQKHCLYNNENITIANILYRPDLLPLPHDALRAIPGYLALFDLEPQARQRHQFNSRLHLRPAQLTHAETRIQQLHTEQQQHPLGYEVAMFNILLELLLFTSRCYSDHPSPEGKHLLTVASLIDRMQSDLNHPWTLDELSHRAGLSHSSVLRAFKDACGTTPVDYLIRLRIAAAMKELRDTNQSITTIAFNNGFNDSNYFSRQFKRIAEMSPRAYRKSLR